MRLTPFRFSAVDAHVSRRRRGQPARSICIEPYAHDIGKRYRELSGVRDRPRVWLAFSLIGPTLYYSNSQRRVRQRPPIYRLRTRPTADHRARVPFSFFEELIGTNCHARFIDRDEGERVSQPLTRKLWGSFKFARWGESLCTGFISFVAKGSRKLHWNIRSRRDKIWSKLKKNCTGAMWNSKTRHLLLTFFGTRVWFSDGKLSLSSQANYVWYIKLSMHKGIQLTSVTSQKKKNNKHRRRRNTFEYWLSWRSYNSYTQKLRRSSRNVQVP